MLRVRDIMTANVVSLVPDQSLRAAADTLVTCRIGGAPVVEGGRVVGVLSATDILEFESVTPLPDSSSASRDEVEDADEVQGEVEEWSEGDDLSSTFFTDMWSEDGPDVAERIASSTGPQWDVLADHEVGEAMSRTICTVDSAMEVSNAAQRMLAAGVQRAGVRGGKPRGHSHHDGHPASGRRATPDG